MYQTNLLLTKTNITRTRKTKLYFVFLYITLATKKIHHLFSTLIVHKDFNHIAEKKATPFGTALDKLFQNYFLNK
ncbi:hypothetical protein BpHYR1_002541 [Brachionus plicatilis]|uniref:Uncharacterized protein n=1 Tax=Brachionus plicatilis TaxID=10195 RepID=A0A3M7S1R4_BRAPC|nr:hypothetical protein BpHYR1_002541 [Brachionus plicatilis]